MPKVNLDITSGFYESLDLDLNAQRCFNMRPFRSISSGSGSRDSVRQLTGWDRLDLKVGAADVTRGSVKGVDSVYVVSGSNLFEITNKGDNPPVDRGAIPGITAISSPVTSTIMMAFNGEIIAIVDPGNSGCDVTFFDTSTNTFTTLDPTGGAANEVALNSLLIATGGTIFDVEFIDGYFIYCGPTGLFSGSLSTVNSGRDFNALDFINLTYKSDETRAIVSYRNRLYGIGERSIQVYQNTAAPNFPLTEVRGAVIDFGVLSADTVIQHESRIYMLGRTENSDYGLYSFDGSSVTKLSTDVVDAQIVEAIVRPRVGLAAFGGPEEAAEEVRYVIWAYKNNNESYIGFNYFDKGINSTEGYSFAYDETQSQLFGAPKWHERGAYLSETGVQLSFCLQFFQVIDFDNSSVQARLRGSRLLGFGFSPLASTFIPARVGYFIVDDDVSGYDNIPTPGGGYQSFFSTQWISDNDASVDVVEIKPSFYKRFFTDFNHYLYGSSDGENFDLLEEANNLTSAPDSITTYKVGRSNIRKVFRLSNSPFVNGKPSFPNADIDHFYGYGIHNVSANVELEFDA